MGEARRSQAGIMRVQATDGPSIDAFSRWRVSNPVSLFDSQQQFGDSALTWVNKVNGTGAVSNSLARASVLLSNGGTASGAYAYRQTRTHFRYQPGKSQLMFITFVMGAVVTNVRKRVGAFDQNNGIFLERSGSTVSLVKRTSTSGSPVDSAIAQAGWNLDKLDGRGASGVKLDLSKSQILIIDFQWLGVGRVRVGFDIGGAVIYVHEFNHANITDVVYVTNPNYAIRFEVENVGVAGGTSTLEHICCSVISEGGFEEDRGFQFTANRGGTALSVDTTGRPVLSIRARTALGTVTNTGQILPRSFDVMALTNPVLVEVWLRPTSLTAASWADVNTAASLAQYDIAATGVSGGYKIASFHVAASASNRGGPGSGGDSFFRKFPLNYVDAGSAAEQDVLTIHVRSTTSNASIWAAVSWQELY